MQVLHSQALMEIIIGQSELCCGQLKQSSSFLRAAFCTSERRIYGIDVAPLHQQFSIDGLFFCM